MCYTILNKNEIGVDIVEGTLLEVKFNFSSGETYSIEGNYVLDFKILIYETEVSKWGTKKYVEEVQCNVIQGIKESEGI